MNVPVQWFGVVLVTTLINGLSLGYIAWREKHRALAFWSWAWFSWAAAVVPLTFIGGLEASPLAAVLCGLCWVVSTLYFLAGTYGLAGRPLPKVWLGVGIAAGGSSIGLALGAPPPVGMVPLVLFQSVGMASAGVLVVRRHRKYAGGWLCGLALIGLGVHVLDAPVAAQRPEWLMWGFVLATALELLTALGMLMLYYEHARVQLVVAQRALAETARMEALGRVAGGVAHDFNNMLAVVQGHLDLGRLGGQKTFSEESFEAIEEAVDQAARLTNQLLTFGRRAVIQPRSTDVRGVVERTVELLRSVIPSSIELRFSAEPAQYVASMDRTLLEQIVLNLVTNARDAISGVGQIEVRLTPAGDASAPRLVLSVIDDGEGMEPAVAEQIFEPFFTTKGEGRGTGLGLASVQGAVSQLGGQIRVESKLGQGTSFVVSLPWLPPVETTPPPPVEVGECSCTILVVDDDAGVRNVTQQMLETEGHRIEQAGNGQEALRKIQNKHFDLIISDLVMPEMSGTDLRALVSRLSPHTKVLLTSGYPRGAEPEDSSIHFLAKPFHRQQLLAAVAFLVGLPPGEPAHTPAES